MSQQAPCESALEKRGVTLSNLDWPVVIGIAAMHIGAVVALWHFSWWGLAVMAVFVWLTGAIGITLTYHRLLTHRSFRSPKWFEYVLTIIGCLAWQGGPIQWVGNHRIHHKHSDEEADPHTPKHGFGWAHMFWCMHKKPEGQTGRDAAKDLQRDKWLNLIDKFFYIPQFPLIAGLYFLGKWMGDQGYDASGLSFVLMGVCLRTVMVYHVTWFVNSATHTWGYRNYETTDQSTNLWWVGLLAFGEGWHNNHHAHQRSAAHGLRWFEFDLTYLTIRSLALVGLARDIVLPDESKMPWKAKAADAGPPERVGIATDKDDDGKPVVSGMTPKVAKAV